MFSKICAVTGGKNHKPITKLSRKIRSPTSDMYTVFWFGFTFTTLVKICFCTLIFNHARCTRTRFRNAPCILWSWSCRNRNPRCPSRRVTAALDRPTSNWRHSYRFSTFVSPLEHGEEAIKEINADFNIPASFYRVDVRDHVAVEEAINGIVRDFGGLDVLLCSAGIVLSLIIEPDMGATTPNQWYNPY